jgi:hypothetical protein
MVDKKNITQIRLNSMEILINENRLLKKDLKENEIIKIKKDIKKLYIEKDKLFNSIKW